MTYRERIRPIRDDEPIYLMQSGPRFCSSASLILVQVVVVALVIGIVSAAMGW